MKFPEPFFVGANKSMDRLYLAPHIIPCLYQLRRAGNNFSRIDLCPYFTHTGRLCPAVAGEPIVYIVCSRRKAVFIPLHKNHITQLFKVFVTGS